MNILVLNTDPQKNAQALCDRSISEALQQCLGILALSGHYEEGLLDRKKHVLGGFPCPVGREKDQNHLLVRWVQEDLRHSGWVGRYAEALAREYLYRFERQHPYSEATMFASGYFQGLQLKFGVKGEPTDFVCYLPDDHNGSVVKAYRSYYAQEIEVPEWTNRMPPSWWVSYRRAAHKLLSKA